MGEDRCFFCEARCEKPAPTGAVELFMCPYCGSYGVTHSLSSIFDDQYKNKKHIFAGYLQATRNNREEGFIITTSNCKIILSDSRIPKTTMQKIEAVLLFFEEISPHIGYTIHLYDSDGFMFFGKVEPKGTFGDITEDVEKYGTKSVAFVEGLSEIKGIIKAMYDLGWVASAIDNKVLYSAFRVSAKGLEHAEKLRRTNLDSTKVFVAMEFGTDLLDSALEQAIKPACADCGFEADIVNGLHNNDINDEIIVGIKRSKFVIVDFTYNNHGAYFEAGFAQGLGREVIRCCNKEWLDNEKKEGKRGLHFDVEHYNFILWSDHEHYAKQLKERIRANIPDAILLDKAEISS